MTSPAAWPPPLAARWETRHAGAPDAGNTVDIWRWRPDEVSPDDAWLTEDERRQAHDLAPGRRQSFIANRRMLRYLLSPWLDCLPGDIRIGRTVTGRPVIAGADTGVGFNLSHSGKLAVLAIGRSAGIGIDIERPRQVSDCLAIARRVFPPSWTEAIEQGGPDRRQTLFRLMWTRYEACQKSHGRGIFAPRAAVAETQVQAFDAGSGYVGHLCLAHRSGRLDPPVLRFLQAVPPD